MNINALIRNYGTKVKIDTIEKDVFFDTQKSSRYKKSKLYSSFNTKVILTKEIINADATIVVDGKNFLVIETIDSPSRNGKIVYSETGIFEDDFIHDIKFYTQSSEMKGCNLPSKSDLPYSEYKARIRTEKPNDYLQFALQGAKVPTHKITIMYQDGINTSDLIIWGDRRFEILSSENIDEQNVFLEMSCIEVLNA